MQAVNNATMCFRVVVVAAINIGSAVLCDNHCDLHALVGEDVSQWYLQYLHSRALVEMLQA